MSTGIALTRNELASLLQNEVRILLHLTTKIDRGAIDYRPTPKQRSTLELLQYLVVMGPELIKAVKAGAFDPPSWTAATQLANTADYDQTLASLANLSGVYAELLDRYSDADLRGEIEMFGQKAARGSLLVSYVLSGHAAYRTQLFLYLKSCGRDELNTFNLWAGMDGQM